jgi:hypothetical protein
VAKREFTGVGRPPQRRPGWNPDELHVHVRGRADATVSILIGVAALRSFNLLNDRVGVSVTGAQWQDWRGSREQPRAHRFPCNPLIGGRDLATCAGTLPALRQLFIDTLAITDSLPFHVNYADRLFEELGGIDAARRGLETVIARQPAGAPIAPAAIGAAWQTVHTAYVQAWQTVERELLDRVNRENAAAFFERTAGVRPTAPTDTIETAMDVVYDAKRSTELVSMPPALSQPGIDHFMHRIRSPGR